MFKTNFVLNLQSDMMKIKLAVKTLSKHTVDTLNNFIDTFREFIGLIML